MEEAQTVLFSDDFTDDAMTLRWGKVEEGNGKYRILVLHDNLLLQTVELEGNEAKEDKKIEIPLPASRPGRSHLRIFAHSDAGYFNDLLIPLENGKIVHNTAQLHSADQHQNLLYFLMVDRFHNGNPSNDAPLPDSGVHPKANYHGGDLAGVTAQLRNGYFDSLGINTIWLSPIVRNPDRPYREYPAPHRLYSGYHGYWPIRSTEVDPRFGTAAELDTLIAEAHRRGHKVLLDFVANHVHESHPMIQAHPEWKTPLYLADSSLNIRIWDAQRLTTWFDTFLPSLDFSNPEVIETQVDSALFWVKRFGIDGFRHDATKHIPTAFWRRLTQRLRTDYVHAENRPLFQIGETFGSRELIGSYVNSGMLDGQFDFNHYFDLRGTLCQDQIPVAKFRETLQASLT
ncbi:MAG: alpha-amylase family glycosyl hydrolase, partial [Bacteroidota bacterium]